MKTLKVILSVLIFISLLNVAGAQTYAGDANVALKKLQVESLQFNLIASQNSSSSSLSNSTRVQQIGDYNTVLSVTKSNSSDILLTQFGKNNGIDLNISANRIEENVVQIGNNHNFTDYSGSRTPEHSANVYQLGANQNLIWLGSQNSISDKMVVSMQGKNQTIIVRNLKN